ncbi:hypothetical protein SDRG_02252 [Saprolegnia diclina VS20]|uniref:phenylalanine 4-monooxygenase n=1 Tax=Saprolegnia diclina (strain VS20) TaxID=1156394 RepID=T0R069_SAPDV|nr:hypothetical protein SDRG_02252 [Saprolegnia diclina VS20]EQC40351.1 hypothetical protein SDRG_02252 [Saprolegnia diclina VS20]|eukprot:XP_008606050.1 hypothetical protein SDRG_02252 [Saprolegnia diclina VS20]
MQRTLSKLATRRYSTQWRSFSALHPSLKQNDLTSITLHVTNHPGSLRPVLDMFAKHRVNLTHITSQPTTSIEPNNDYAISIDFQGKPGTAGIDNLLRELEAHCASLTLAHDKTVPWFPLHISDLDIAARHTLQAGTDIDADHPGFSDQVYRARRNELSEIAANYRQGQPLPHIHYSELETQTWGAVYNRIKDTWAQFACDEFNNALPMLERECGYSPTNIPQAHDISTFLKARTGFVIHPVTGYLSPRDFLNGLAFRVFFCTQYIRHHSQPLYTPEPDICHELMGHVPMFADQDFADFSHEIGLASLGVSDDEIERLAACYIFSVEFGIYLQNGQKKAFGAGMLSSFGELEYACSPVRPAGGTMDMPEYRPWDPFHACKQKYPVTTYQPVYYVAESLSQAKDKMREFTREMKKPFHATYNPATQTIAVDRAITIRERCAK